MLQLPAKVRLNLYCTDFSSGESPLLYLWILLLDLRLTFKIDCLQLFVPIHAYIHIAVSVQTLSILIYRYLPHDISCNLFVRHSHNGLFWSVLTSQWTRPTCIATSWHAQPTVHSPSAHTISYSNENFPALTPSFFNCMIAKGFS